MWQGSRQKKSKLSLNTRTSSRRPLKQRASLSGKSKLKQLRVRKRLFIFIAVVSLFVFLIVGASFVSFSKILSLRTLSVVGNQSIHSGALEARTLQYTAGAYAGLFSKQNIFLFPANDLEKVLEFEFPRAERIKVKRNLFNRTIKLNVSERTPYALWCRSRTTLKTVDEAEVEDMVVEEECFLADKTGFLFGAATGEETLITLYEGVKHPDGSMLRKNVTPTYFRDVVTLLTGLQSLNLHITSVTFIDDEAEVLVSPGWKLLINLSKDVSVVPVNLATVIDEDELGDQLGTLDYIDLRFDDRAYYKFRQ